MSLQRAIEQLQAEVDAFNQGTPSQPKDGTTEFFLLRAKALGLASLKQMEKGGVEGNIAAAERLYRDGLQLAKRELNA
jgi:hypothetical protein